MCVRRRGTRRRVLLHHIANRGIAFQPALVCSGQYQNVVVFQERIDQELQRQYQQDNKQLEELRSSQSQLDKRRNDLESTLAELAKQEADWGKILDSEAVGRAGQGRTGVPGAGPVFLNAQSQQGAARRRIQEVRFNLDEMERSLPQKRQRLDGQFRREEVGKIATS
jgi:hypothetical protein